MKRHARRQGLNGMGMRRPARALRHLAAGDCVIARQVRSRFQSNSQGVQLITPHEVHIGPSAAEEPPLRSPKTEMVAVVPWQPPPMATKEAPAPAQDCTNCSRCLKRKEFVGNSSRCFNRKEMVKEEIEVLPSTAIMVPLAELQPLPGNEALPKEPRGPETPLRQPPCTRSQTLAALRLENAALKEGYVLLNCCWRRILELHLPEEKYMKLVKQISEAL